MQTIFYHRLTLIMFMILCISLSCKKNNGTAPMEQTLVVTTDAPALSYSPSPDFKVNVTVESIMPADGVSITLLVKGEADNFLYFSTNAIPTNNKTTSIVIRNLPQQKICICTISVVSRSNPNNKSTNIFRVGYK